jgi:hypothetical protein
LSKNFKRTNIPQQSNRENSIEQTNGKYTKQEETVLLLIVIPIPFLIYISPKWLQIF